MKLAFVFCLLSMTAAAANLNLPTPGYVVLNPTVSFYGCYAYEGHTVSLQTTVTGFSADGNYVTGQVKSYYTCGHARTIYLCTYLTWDLSGNLVSSNTPSSPTNQNLYCPSISMVYPPTTPPGGSVVGNEFTKGPYTAETILTEACGSLACYATYFNPELVTP